MINISFKEDNKIINLKASVCKNKDIYNYMNFDYFTGLCREGCSHYNKSHTCPPNSPKYNDYTKDYENTLLIAMYTNIDDKNNISTTHAYLRKVLYDILLPLEKKFNGLYTDGGRCMYCNKCTYIDNLACRFPEKMRFSMEAMGIDLDIVCREFLNHKIVWDESDTKAYCTVLGSINFNGDFKEQNFEKAILNLKECF